MRRPKLLTPLLLLAVGCASTSTPVAASGAVASSGTVAASSTAATSGTVAASSTVATSAAATHPAAKVLVVMLENHSEKHALAAMPRLAALARTYGYTSNDKAITHPSLPNYLALAGGSTFGVVDDAGPASHRLHGPSVFDQAIAAGATAKVYAEAMGARCAPTTTTRYAARHNPWTYFADPGSVANCRRNDVPAGTTRAGALRADVVAGRLPTLGMVIPDICNDGHSCNLDVTDRWLSGWLGVVRAAPDWKAGRLTVVVTFDEDDHSQANTVLTVVLSPRLHHVVVRRGLNHYSLTRFLNEVAGVSPLRQARQAVSLGAAFGLTQG